MPSLYWTVTGVGLYFATLHTWQKISPLNGHRFHSMLDGALARSLASIALMPFTVIKTRMESNHFQYRSVSHAVIDIWRSQGIRGLYRGTFATVVRDAPYSGLYLQLYRWSTQAI